MGRPPSIYLEDTDCKFPDNEADPQISGGELGCKSPRRTGFSITSTEICHSPCMEISIYGCLSTMDAQTRFQPRQRVI